MSLKPTKSYRHPDFLSAQDYPLLRVRCPIHGFIHFSENERKIIDHPLFRRLRYIKQLALTEFVYPGALHSRFEHALGVMEVASKAFDSLATRNGHLLESTFRQIPDFRKAPLALARQLLRIAALLHDVGHASFSHAAERVVNNGEGHEKLTLRILRHKNLFGKTIDGLFGSGFSERVAQIIEGTDKLPPQLQILRNLVSGEMDADRTDYLLRDSYHCGVEYGHFDHRWMIERLELKEDQVGGLELALNRDALHTFEALILARYYMNAHVYQHRIRRIYDYYLEQYCKTLGGLTLLHEDEIIANDDITMMARIFKDSSEGRKDSREWAIRIRDREHHKVVHETGLDADAMDLKRSKEVLRVLQARYSDKDFIYNEASATIHKLYVPGVMEEGAGVNLQLIGQDKRTRPIGGESQVLKTLPRRFQCARIFCDLASSSAGIRKEIEKRAIREWQNQGGR